MAGAAFWGFMAVVVVAGIWRQIAARREAEETMRLAIEKGQQLDPALVDKLMRPPQRHGPEGLLVGGGVMLASGIGLPVMGYFISMGGNSEALYPLIGVGCLTSLVGLSLLCFGVLFRKWRVGR